MYLNKLCISNKIVGIMLCALAYEVAKNHDFPVSTKNFIFCFFFFFFAVVIRMSASSYKKLRIKN